MSKLNEKILEFRENVGQSIEGLALLMKMEPDEYVELEKEWIPPDNLLKKLCSLFEWNYIEIKKLAVNSSSKNQKKNNSESTSNSIINNNDEDSRVALFSKMIIEARNKVKQDEEGIATLMGIPVEYYKEIEGGLLPPNELIRKLCTLFGWNYKQIKQKINAQSTMHFDTRQLIIDPSKNSKCLSKDETQFNTDIEPPIPFYELIHRARVDADQNVEGISLLLQISPELYEQIESGTVKPEPDLLKRISSLFGWNYHDLLNREKSSNFEQLLPAITKLDSKEISKTEVKLKKIQNEIEDKWKKISKEHQETLLTQLDFLLGSMQDLNKND